MNALLVALRRHRRRVDGSESGFTLIEVAITIAILGAITAAIAGSFVTAMSSARVTQQRVYESNDAQLISAFLVRDAQSAGGSDPLTGVVDPTIGVALTDDTDGCHDPTLSPGLVVSFRWYDRAPGGTTPTAKAANYYRQASNNQLIRRLCSGNDFTPGGMVFDSAAVMGQYVASAVASCVPAASCPPASGVAPPNLVTLTITSTNTPTNSSVPYQYTLSAAVRAESQVTPVLTNSTPVALMSLNSSAGSCAMSGTNATNGIRVGGLDVKVSGATIVNTPDATSCPAMRVVAGTVYNATSTSIVAGGNCTNCTNAPLPDVLDTPFPDPYVANASTGYTGLPTPALASQCATATTNPARGVRTVTGTKVSGTPNITVTAGTMTAADVGATVSGTGISANTSILSQSGTAFVMSKNATSSGSITITVTSPWPSTTSAATVYGAPGGLTVNLAESLESGTPGTPAIFIFCHGLKFIGLSDDTNAPVPIVVRNAMFYLAGSYPGCPLAGSICYYNAANTAPTIANFNIQSPTSGPYQNVAIWQPASNNANLSIPGGDDQTNAIVGSIYAPSAYVSLDNGDIDLAADNSVGLVDPVGLTIGGIVADRISINSGKVAVGPFSIVTPSLPSAKVGTAYTATLTAAGGTLPYNTWTATGLPPGLTINASTGVISGTPTSGGCTAPFVNITVSDSSTPAQSTFHDYQLTIIPSNITITTSSLVNGEVNAPYSAAIATTGGCTPFTWTATGLPAGLTINPGTGVISGTPTTAVVNASVVVTASYGAAPVISTSRTLTLTIKPQLAITTATLPNGMDGVGYPSTTLTATGGQTPYVWALASGSLPPGLSVSAGGVVSGTPTAVGTFTFDIGVSDALGGSTTRTYTVTIVPQPLVISPPTLPDGGINRAYTATVTVAGGTGPYTWNVGSGSLPNGLTMSAGGVISGTPTARGVFTFDAVVTDSVGATATKTYTITIRARATNVTLANTTGVAGTADGGDTVTIKYSNQLAVASMCSTWVGDSTNQVLNGTGNVVVTLTDAGANDLLTVAVGSCTFNMGAVSLGANYTTTTRTFGATGSASTINWNATTFTLVIRFGTASAPASVTGVAVATPSYTASGGFTDTSGLAIGTAAESGTVSRF